MCSVQTNAVIYVSRIFIFFKCLSALELWKTKISPRVMICIGWHRQSYFLNILFLPHKKASQRWKENRFAVFCFHWSWRRRREIPYSLLISQSRFMKKFSLKSWPAEPKKSSDYYYFIKKAKKKACFQWIRHVVMIVFVFANFLRSLSGIPATVIDCNQRPS